MEGVKTAWTRAWRGAGEMSRTQVKQVGHRKHMTSMHGDGTGGLQVRPGAHVKA